MSRLFFPLRTSVEFFNDPTNVHAIARAKEAAILYDEIVFETGLYTINITEQGSANSWIRPEALTTDRLDQAHRLPEPGQWFQIAAGLQESPHTPAPADEMRVVMQGALTASYVAEWHSGVVSELQALASKLPWVALVETGGDNDSSLEPLKGARRDAERALGDAFPQHGQQNPWIRNFMVKALARDALIASSLNAAMSVTSMFGPLMQALGSDPDPSGQAALGVLVPNFSSLSWEEIVEFREHSGAVEARGKLREFEERAVASSPDDPLDFRQKIYQEISDAFFAVIQDLRPRFAEDVGVQAAEFAVSFIPVIGPFVGPGASFAKALQDTYTQQHAWYAALMRLRSAAAN